MENIENLFKHNIFFTPVNEDRTSYISNDNFSINVAYISKNIMLEKLNIRHVEDLLKQIDPLLLAHLSTTCSRAAFRVVRCPSSLISLNIFSSQTAGPVWTKLGRNGPLEVLFKNCSQNLIQSKTLVAMATKLNFLSNS